jgi:branched-chain amino acid aminotransferase
MIQRSSEMTETTDRTAHPAHGELFTDHMVTATWTVDEGWGEATLRPLEPLPMNPGMIGLHYGQVIFEGLKAHRQADGSMAIFRPQEHARRFQRSAQRLAMPELPVDRFMSAVEEVVRSDQQWLSDDPGLSLYLRPLMFASEASLALRTSREYTFLTMAFITGAFFGEGVDAVTVWVNREHPRAMPGGTGNVKCAANYGPAFLAQRKAEDRGCHQVVWLDAVERRWVEELGGMNLFFVRGQGPGATVVTPELTGTLLPGVTRKSLLMLAERLGYRAQEERISVEQWQAECASGTISEVFACGTAAVVTPVGEVRDGDETWTVGDGKPGPVAAALHDALVGLHHGLIPDPDGWMHPVT